MQRISTRWQCFPTHCYYFRMRWQRFRMRWQRSSTRCNLVEQRIANYVDNVRSALRVALCVTKIDSFGRHAIKNKSKTIQ